MRHLVIGRGQVGSALIEVLSDGYTVDSIDVGEAATDRYDVLHVCIPYKDARFSRAVLDYADLYLELGGLVIIHSSVRVGTSAALNAVHSPIRGVHPNLAEGIRTFVKFFGGTRAEEAADVFRALGINCYTTPEARNTEALKLWDTTYYGWNIIFEKAVKQYCETYGLDFNIVYTLANESYNQGYAELGMDHVLRPVLKHYPGPIGGHCVIPNAKLLNNGLANYLLDFNGDLLEEQAA